MRIDNIKKKIQKLLSLAKSPNENEAALALQKAQMLLEKYSLSIEDVYQLSENDVVEQTILSRQRMPVWIEWLTIMIVDIFGVKAYYDPEWRWNGKKYYIQKNLRFVGFDADVLIAKHCFVYLKRAIDNGHRTWLTQLRKNNSRIPPGCKNAYALGFIEGVKDKMAQLTKAQQNQEVGHASNLPVLKSNAIKKYMEKLNLKKAKKRNPKLDHASYLAGTLDGAKTPVSRPVNGVGEEVRALS